jgi:type IV secretion system protein VirB1
MATFETLAAKCAATVALDILLGLASIESGVRAFSIRTDGPPIAVPDAGTGIALVVAASDKGRDVGIGLLGLSERQLAKSGVSITDAFAPCSNLRAGAAQFERAAQDAVNRGLVGAAIEKSAIRSWWRPDGGYVSSEAYERAVQTARKTAMSAATKDLGGDIRSVDADKPEPKASPVATPRQSIRPDVSISVASKPTPPCWDVFARARFGVQC